MSEFHHVVADALRKAKESISDPAKWGQGAICLRPGTKCAAEAIIALDLPLDVQTAAFRVINEVAGENGVIIWNDSNNHQTVLDGFDQGVTLLTA